MWRSIHYLVDLASALNKAPLLTHTVHWSLVPSGLFWVHALRMDVPGPEAKQGPSPGPRN